jgi:hypothetical protein
MADLVGAVATGCRVSALGSVSGHQQGACQPSCQPRIKRPSGSDRRRTCALRLAGHRPGPGNRQDRIEPAVRPEARSWDLRDGHTSEDTLCDRSWNPNRVVSAVTARPGAPKTDDTRLIGKQLPDGRRMQFGPFGQLLRREDSLFYRTGCFSRIHTFYCSGSAGFPIVRRSAAMCSVVRWFSGIGMCFFRTGSVAPIRARSSPEWSFSSRWMVYDRFGYQAAIGMKLPIPLRWFSMGACFPP